MRLKGKKALITGGNSGVGLATARLFIAEGAQVAITGQDQMTLDSAIQKLGPEAVAFKADVSDAADREQLFADIGERFGWLDIVFANAGIAGTTPLGGAEEEIFDRILKVNVTGAFFTVQEALPYLRPGSSVVLNGSVMATLGPAGSSAYAASKAAVRAMAHSLAAELSPRGIRVNVVVREASATPIWSRSRPGVSTAAQEDQGSRLNSKIPLARWGEADEIAQAVLFLASSDSSYVPGAELVVDGGATGIPIGAAAYRN
jgi:NAD(P)-dependent dehydrogenase (short-subunit alcohol dehydrogenase family)